MSMKQQTPTLGHDRKVSGIDPRDEKSSATKKVSSTSEPARGGTTLMTTKQQLLHKDALTILFQQDILPWDDAMALGGTCNEFHQLYLQNKPRILQPLMEQLEELIKCCNHDHYFVCGDDSNTIQPTRTPHDSQQQNAYAAAATTTTTYSRSTPPTTNNNEGGDTVMNNEDEDDYGYFPFLDMDPECFEQQQQQCCNHDNWWSSIQYFFKSIHLHNNDIYNIGCVRGRLLTISRHRLAVFVFGMLCLLLQHHWHPTSSVRLHV